MGRFGTALYELEAKARARMLVPEASRGSNANGRHMTDSRSDGARASSAQIRWQFKSFSISRNLSPITFCITFDLSYLALSILDFSATQTSLIVDPLLSC